MQRLLKCPSPPVRALCMAFALTLFLPRPYTAAADWPQWRGPNRDMRSDDTGLLKIWPKDGPVELWSVDGMGKGFSTVSIATGTIYVTGAFGEEERLTALDLMGAIQWQKAYGKAWHRSYPGARTTPTVAGSDVFVISSQGQVACLNAASGAIIWQVDTLREYKGRNLRWGISESPLVVDGKVICTAGGPSAGLVALSQGNGRLVWRAGEITDKSAYCSPLLVQHGARKMIVTMTEKHVVALNPKNGSLLWKHPYMNEWSAHPNTPIYRDGKIFVTSGYDRGATLLELAPNHRGVRVVWENKTLDTHHGNVVLADGYLYGSTWEGNAQGNWVCLDFLTGKVMYDTPWKPKGARPLKGSLIHADGMLYCYEEKHGFVGLVPATPKEFRVVSAFRVVKGAGPHWAHPVVTGGRLYIRHGDVLTAYDLRAR